MLNLTNILGEKLYPINQTNFSPLTILAASHIKGNSINSIAIGVDSILTTVNDSLINSFKDKSSDSSSSESMVNGQSMITTASPVPFKECKKEEKFCSVTRIEYVASEVKKKKFWAVERGCSSNCRQGCIILGEGKFRFIILE